MTILNFKDLDLQGKRVLIREDLNVPIQNGKILSNNRIKAIVPTINIALKKGAAVLICSHLGRPQEGVINPELSLKIILRELQEIIGRNIHFFSNYREAVGVQPGQIGLLENVRFNLGEKQNLDGLSAEYAELCDVFVMDAFATAHRKESSTYGVIKHSPLSVAGPLLLQEVECINKVLMQPKRPLLAIVGGAKVSSKLDLLTNLSSICDEIIVGGGIANTFLAAKGFNIGNSLYEPDLIKTAQKILNNVNVPLPVDVVVSNEISIGAKAQVKDVRDISSQDIILDVGPQTSQTFSDIISKSKTILWNGPLGVFEYSQFSKGTEQLAKNIARSSAYSVAGGGDTIAAIEKFNVEQYISYISTGGGAFLELVEGKKLAALEALNIF